MWFLAKSGEKIMSKFKHSKINELPSSHKNVHEGYEYIKNEFVPRGFAEKTMVSIYEIPPHKSAYPYHYHLKNEETFYIISGEGVLTTPEGERRVSAGELLFFPASSEGAHKLTNTSDTENLVYIDFDVIHDIDVTLYPNSDKIAVWGKDTNKVFRTDSNVDYYEGE